LLRFPAPGQQGGVWFIWGGLCPWAGSGRGAQRVARLARFPRAPLVIRRRCPPAPSAGVLGLGPPRVPEPGFADWPLAPSGGPPGGPLDSCSEQAGCIQWSETELPSENVPNPCEARAGWSGRVSLSCDARTYDQAKKGYTGFARCPFVLRIYDAKRLGHKHGHECLGCSCLSCQTWRCFGGSKQPVPCTLYSMPSQANAI